MAHNTPHLHYRFRRQCTNTTNASQSALHPLTTQVMPYQPLPGITDDTSEAEASEVASDTDQAELDAEAQRLEDLLYGTPENLAPDTTTATTTTNDARQNEILDSVRGLPAALERLENNQEDLLYLINRIQNDVYRMTAEIAAIQTRLEENERQVTSVASTVASGSSDGEDIAEQAHVQTLAQAQTGGKRKREEEQASGSEKIMIRLKITKKNKRVKKA